MASRHEHRECRSDIRHRRNVNEPFGCNRKECMENSFKKGDISTSANVCVSANDIVRESPPFSVAYDGGNDQTF